MSSGGVRTYKLEDAYSVLDNIRGTPRYWKKAKMEMLAKIDNFGPFHWFYTLSCADMRWEENFSSILREKGYKIIWQQVKNEGRFCFKDVTVKVEFTKNGKIEDPKDLSDFLRDECDESMHESIRTNVFTATRNFVNRVKAFRAEILMAKSNPMKIIYWSDKMEFQGRGAAHIHGVAWSDLNSVSKLIDKERKANVVLPNREMSGTESNISHLEKAYKSLRENKTLTEEEETALIDFVDISVTCTLNPELAAKMVDLSLDKEHGLEIIKIVKECMVHHHTKTCRKLDLGNGCRFRFPKFPIWQTILTKGPREQNDIDDEKIKRIIGMCT